MGEIINNFFNPQGITLWKLYTPQDYLFIGLLIVLGAAALWLATRQAADAGGHHRPDGEKAAQAGGARGPGLAGRDGGLPAGPVRLPHDLRRP